MRRSALAALILSIFFLCSLSFADSTFTFNEGTGTGPTSDILNSGGNSLTVSGFTTAGSTPTDLYFKNGGGDETGLGLVDGSSDFEVSKNGGNFIQFTAAGVKSISVGSVQTGESWVLYGSNTSGSFSAANIVASGTTGGSANVNPGSWKYLDFAAGAKGDVLLDSVTVPEPSTPALILTIGLLGLFEVTRRKLFA